MMRRRIRLRWKIIVGIVCLAVLSAATAGGAARTSTSSPTLRATSRKTKLRVFRKRSIRKRRYASAKKRGQARRLHRRVHRRHIRYTKKRPASIAVAPENSVESRRRSTLRLSAFEPRTAPALPFIPAPEPSSLITPAPAPQTPTVPPIRSIRFDAAYFYGRGQSARALAEELTDSWEQQGINLVYYYAYNRVYGARYYTRYEGVILEDYGRQDLLGRMLEEAHRRDIKVVAWFYGPQSKTMWEAHPEWRQKTAVGADYRPEPDSYPLCSAHPDVQAWWLGMMEDLLTRYPELDGIDIAEPQVELWGESVCHCAHCCTQFATAYPHAKPAGQEWLTFRAQGLTNLLLATNRLIHQHRKEAHLTTVFTACPEGQLMATREVRNATGFDLQALLASPDRPEVVQVELIWQQWAAIHRNRRIFTPRWTERAVRQARARVGGRARFIAHVELTDFGSGGLTHTSLRETIAAAMAGRPEGVDIYDAHLLAQASGMAQQLRTAWMPGRAG